MGLRVTRLQVIGYVTFGISGCEYRQSYMLQHAFSGNSKQLQQYDSVYLSSVNADYIFSS